MSGQGIQVTAFSTLQDLRKRLADNYPISSIVKELLQNAEDACSKTAGAGRLDFAWVAALPGAEHPLLQGPGLVVVNDGELTAADCDALSSYGINHKAGDRSTIGRFGLGLKSVFNLGEAFFYASSTPDAKNPGGHLDEVVSPWFGTGCHEDWRDFSRTDDRTRLREFLAPLLTGEHWFCLWVPLRRQAPDGEPDPIRGTFPGDEVACPAEHLSDKTALFVAGVLPLLRHLHTVRGWCHWAGPDSVAAPTFTVAVEPGGARGLFPDANELTQPRTGGGTVTVCLASGAESWPYAVAQAWQPDLATLRREPNWPKTLTLTSGYKSVKEKAEPHAAVSVVHRPGPTPSLSIRNAVFLPLSADGDTATAGASPGEVTVLLHGCVFVDSGRGEAKAGVDPLRDEWNRRLTAEGTRPRLIPALAQLCRDVPTVAAALTASLAAHPAVTPHLGDFCGEWRWLYRWTPAGAAGYAVAPAAGNFYELPDFGDDATLPTRALPRLAEFRRLVVAVAGRPRLSASDPSPWPDDALGKLLAVEAPASLAALEYLASFVQSQQPLGVQAVAALTATLRGIYSTAAFGELEKNGDALGRLTAALPDDARLGLSFNRWGDRVRCFVVAAARSVLIIPDGFGRDGTGRFPTDEATAVLETLATHTTTTRSGAPATEVVKRSIDPAAVLAATRELTLWAATAADGKAVARSHAQLEACKASRRLFTAGVSGLPAELACALGGAEVLLLSDAAAEVLFPSIEVPPCDLAATAKALAAAPSLGPPGDRKALVSRFGRDNAPENAAAGREAGRHLLSGSADLAPDTDLFAASNAGGVWDRLAEVALQVGNSVTADCELADLLTPQVRLAWRVKSNTIGDVTDLLLCLDLESLGLAFTEAERDQLLHDIVEKELLRRLALHGGPGGWQAIGVGCFWRWHDYTPPAGDLVGVTLLTLHADPVHAARQGQLADAFTPARHLDRLLAGPDPVGRARAILNALNAHKGWPSGELARRVRETAWLPTTGGPPVAPDAVAYHAVYGDTLDRFLTAAPDPGTLVPAGRLAAWVREWPQFRTLAAWLFANPPLLPRLAYALSHATAMHVGVLTAAASDLLADWVSAFRGVPPAVMPLAELIAAIYADDAESCGRFVWPNVRGGLPDDRLVEVLNHLASRHQPAVGTARAAIGKVHDAYLALVTATTLPKLKHLRNRPGNWVAPATLCVAEGVEERHQLDERQQEILGHLVEQQTSVSGGNRPAGPTHAVTDSYEERYRRGVADLKTYFREWVRIDPVTVGAFVAMLGDHPHMDAWATELLDGVATPNRVRADAKFTHRPNMRFLVQVKEVVGGRLRVPNLLGEVIDVPATDVPPTLYATGGGTIFAEAPSTYPLRLRTVAPPPDAEKRREILAATAAILFRTIYGQSGADLLAALRAIRDSEPPDVGLAQSAFLNAAAYPLGSYGVAGHAGLARILKLYGDASWRQAEEFNVPAGGKPLDGKKAEVLLREAWATLRQAIEGDTNGTCDAILAGVRRKLSESSYRAESVALELFQNADDACVERGGGGTFVVAWSDDTVDFGHDGRAINAAGGTLDRETARRDLQKMLSLNHSDKGLGDKAPVVTGRFGLGFKSVFLVADRPEVVSGPPSKPLHFAVLGGVYPLATPRGEQHRLNGRRDELGLQDGGTLFRLPLRDGVGVDAVVGPLLRSAHWLAVFALKVRTIRVIDGPVDQWVRWTADVLAEGVGVVVEVGTRYGTTQAGADGRGKALVVRVGAAAVAFALDTHGFTRLDDAVPTVWATAPTQECAKVGFLVNSPRFKLDPGRAQLDHASTENRDLARDLGRGLGDGLALLFDALAADAPALMGRMGLTGTDPRLLWKSLWKLFGQTFPAGMLKNLVWDAKDGAPTQFYRNRAALPTGLPHGDYGELTSLAAVQFQLTGDLDAPAGAAALGEVLSWPKVRAKYAPGKIVSSRVIADALPRELTVGWGEVDLAKMLGVELEDANVTPERATRISRVTGVLSSHACFLTASGDWRPARQLVTHCAFAPAGHQLAAGYDAVGIALVRESGEYRPTGDVLFQWAIAATDGPRIAAVLDYLLHGEHRWDLMARLRAAPGEPWVNNASVQTELDEHYDSPRRAMLLGMLRVQTAGQVEDPGPGRRGSTDTRTTGNGVSNDESDRPPPPPPDAMRRIAAWWRLEGRARTRSYNALVYPNGTLPQVDAEGPGDDIDDRVEWLKLFFAGCLTTLGRVQPEQNRDFLGRFERDGWFALLAQPGGGSHEWLDAVHRYVDRREGDRIEWNHWLRQFVGMTTIARHLDAYAASFLTAGPAGVNQVRSPRANSQLQGSDFDAPPIGSILGRLGPHVVIRDLYRMGAVDHPRAQRHCWPPGGTLVKFLRGSLGFAVPDPTSADIADFVAAKLPGGDCTFGGAFDLPLYILSRAENSDLARQVLAGEPQEATR